MGAASVVPDPTVQVSESALPAGLARHRGRARKLRHRRARARRRRASKCASGGARSWRPTGCAAWPMPPSKVCWFATAKPSSRSTTNSRRSSAAPTADSAVGTKLEQYLPDDGCCASSCSSARISSVEGDPASTRRLEMPVEAHPARRRLGRQAASRHRGSRSSRAQASRREHPVSGSPRRAHGACPIAAASTRSSIRRSKRRWPRGGGLPSCVSTSTGSRRSTICSDMPQAIARFRRSPSALPACSMTTRCWRG